MTDDDYYEVGYKEGRADAADEIEQLRAQVAMLREALTDCAGGIEANLRARYGIGESGYIDLEIQRRFVRDMQPAFDARAALEKTT